MIITAIGIVALIMVGFFLGVFCEILYLYRRRLIIHPGSPGWRYLIVRGKIIEDHRAQDWGINPVGGDWTVQEVESLITGEIK